MIVLYSIFRCVYLVYAIQCHSFGVLMINMYINGEKRVRLLKGGGGIERERVNTHAKAR
jgi:hypothetical protein